MPHGRGRPHRSTAATSRSTTSGSSRSPTGPAARRCGSAGSRSTRPCYAGSSATDPDALRGALSDAGRHPGSLELVGGIRGRFPDDRSTASIDEALEQVPPQLAAGYTAICFKPSMYTDDPHAVPELCRHVVESIRKM